MKSIFIKKGLKKLKNLKNSILIYVLFITFLYGCFQSNFNESNYVARFGENYLSKEKFNQLMGVYHPSDSLNKANEVINEWALSKILLSNFESAEKECKSLLDKKLALPAYDQCLKASHIFNLLDSRGVISVAERTGYINRIRELAKGSGSIWLDNQIEK